jgi:hypothetical protein
VVRCLGEFLYTRPDVRLLLLSRNESFVPVEKMAHTRANDAVLHLFRPRAGLRLPGNRADDLVLSANLCDDQHAGVIRQFLPPAVPQTEEIRLATSPFFVQPIGVLPFGGIEQKLYMFALSSSSSALKKRRIHSNWETNDNVPLPRRSYWIDLSNIGSFFYINHRFVRV